MGVMQRLRMFVAEEPVVAASCIIGGIGIKNPNYFCRFNLISINLCLDFRFTL